MLLQRQYSLWKLGVNMVFLLGSILLLASFFFSWRKSSIQDDIKKANAELVKINDQISKIENSGIYKKFNIASLIMKKENTTNYVGLYLYLTYIKNTIQKSLKANNVTDNRFVLKINKDRVDVSLMIPNYNILYDKSSNLLDSIASKSFIRKIDINNYRVKGMNAKFVYFDMVLYTDTKK